MTLDDIEKKKLLHLATRLELKAAALRALVDGKPIQSHGEPTWYDHEMEDYEDLTLLYNPYTFFRPKP